MTARLLSLIVAAALAASPALLRQTPPAAAHGVGLGMNDTALSNWPPLLSARLQRGLLVAPTAPPTGRGQ